MARQGIHFDVMQVKAFPFNNDVKKFFDEHEQVFVVEQNRDAQFRSLLINELDLLPNRVLSVLNFDGMPITAALILKQIKKQMH